MSHVIQFGYRHGRPQNCPLVDCRCLRNTFKPGERDIVLRMAVRKDPRFEEMVQQAVDLLQTEPVIGIGCTFGRHRSVAVTMEVLRRVDATVRWQYPFS